MKNIFFTAIVAVFLLAATQTLVAQEAAPAPAATAKTASRPQTPEQIKNLLDRTEGYIDPVNLANPQKNTTGRNTDPARPSPVQPGPGDHAKFLLYASTGQFVRRGDITEFSLFSLETAPRAKYYVVGTILKPGYGGDYDGTVPVGYFSADQGTGSGGIVAPHQGQQILVHRRMFNEEENMGKFHISFSIFDEQYVLVQQIWVQMYLVDAGQWGRSYYIERVRANPYASHMHMTAVGKFPAGIPIFYLAGVPRYSYGMSGSHPSSAAYSHDGRTLNLSRIIFSRETALDIVLWSPYNREAIIQRNALIEGLPLQE